MKAFENDALADILIRTNLQPGTLEAIVELHRVVLGQERGFDPTFASYVAEPLAVFVGSRMDRQRLWIAEEHGQIVGSIAIVAVSGETAQLRWFLVDPACRGKGLGKRLLAMAISFARECDYSVIVLWTESALVVAAHLYRLVGFELIEEIPGQRWGVDLVEERYELRLG